VHRAKNTVSVRYVHNCHAPVTVGSAMLLSGGTCQYGRLPSSSRATVQTMQYCVGWGRRNLLSSRQILLNFQSNYKNSDRSPTPEQVFNSPLAVIKMKLGIPSRNFNFFVYCIMILCARQKLMIV
jgi:hypothetical protein